MTFVENGKAVQTVADVFMKKKSSEILKYVASAVIAGVMLYFSFRGVEWGDFVGGLRTCRWGYILVSMLLGVAAFWLRGLRWRQLILPLDSSLTRVVAFDAVNIGYLANFVFPRIGEFVRCGVISRNAKDASYEKVLGTVVLERAWDMASMLILLVVLLSARWERFGDFFVNQIWTPAAARVDFSLWWILGALCLIALLAVWIIWHFRKTSSFCSKVWSVFYGLFQGFATCASMKRKWLFFLHTALIWTAYWLMAYFTMRAVPELDSLGLVDALFLSLAGSVGWIVPVPGGIGAFHFVVSLALSTIYGLQFSQGIVFATLSHESQAVTMLLFGALSFAAETFRKKRIS